MAGLHRAPLERVATRDASITWTGPVVMHQDTSSPVIVSHHRRSARRHCPAEQLVPADMRY